MDIDTARAAARDCTALLRNRLRDVDPDQRAEWLERWSGHFRPQVNDLAAGLPAQTKRAARRATG